MVFEAGFSQVIIFVSLFLLQGDELQLLAGLASDAAGLLWELAAMHDTGDAATDMLAKSEQLQVYFAQLQHVQAWQCVTAVHDCKHLTALRPGCASSGKLAVLWHIITPH